jgi:small subunit ribosomal protein S9
MTRLEKTAVDNPAKKFFHGTGRRKTAVATTRLYTEGNNTEIKIIVNNENIEQYFDVSSWRNIVLKPLNVTEQINKFRIICKIKGSGKKAQAEALSLGISRALEQVEPGFRGVLKNHKLLTRDARRKERKKPGQKGARAKFQYGKR